MCPVADTDVDMDVELKILEDLDFDTTPQCDNESCNKDATHVIRCHCQQGVEYICAECAIGLRQAAMANPLAAVILFDKNKSCGHLSPVIACSIEPL